MRPICLEQTTASVFTFYTASTVKWITAQTVQTFFKGFAQLVSAGAPGWLSSSLRVVAWLPKRGSFDRLWLERNLPRKIPTSPDWWRHKDGSESVALDFAGKLGKRVIVEDFSPSLPVEGDLLGPRTIGTGQVVL